MASAERCPSPGPPLSLIVSLQTVFEVHQCGGTLVAEDWILTSAQCLDPLPVYAKFGLRDLGADINDINGDAYGVRYLNCVLGRRVTGMVRHPGYNWRTLENDVALLRVASLSRVEMASAFVPLVALAGARANLTAPEYVSAGWGAEGYISGANADVAAVARFSPALQPSRIRSCNYSYDNKVRGRCAARGLRAQRRRATSTRAAGCSSVPETRCSSQPSRAGAVAVIRTAGWRPSSPSPASTADGCVERLELRASRRRRHRHRRRRPSALLQLRAG